MFPEGAERGAVSHRRRDAVVLPRPRPLPRASPATATRCGCCCRRCVDIVEHHLRGTRFGIGVDPADGLLRQGAEGYQLTWMDAKVGDWVVTPRRGKAVEINALWYNALRLLAGLAARASGDDAADLRARRRRPTASATSFNERFWNDGARLPLRRRRRRARRRSGVPAEPAVRDLAATTRCSIERAGSRCWTSSESGC